MLTLVSSVPDFFAISGLGAVREGVGFGCSCARCGREVSAPFGYERAHVWCLYCGMGAGHVPMVESPWPTQWSFGQTREECLEDKAALDTGDFEAVAEARARRYGKVIDLFG